MIPRPPARSTRRNSPAYAAVSSGEMWTNVSNDQMKSTDASATPRSVRPSFAR
jgi:hypothetical protein